MSGFEHLELEVSAPSEGAVGLDERGWMWRLAPRYWTKLYRDELARYATESVPSACWISADPGPARFVDEVLASDGWELVGCLELERVQVPRNGGVAGRLCSYRMLFKRILAEDDGASDSTGEDDDDAPRHVVRDEPTPISNGAGQDAHSSDDLLGVTGDSRRAGTHRRVWPPDPNDPDYDQRDYNQPEDSWLSRSYPYDY